MQLYSFFFSCSLLLDLIAYQCRWWIRYLQGYGRGIGPPRCQGHHRQQNVRNIELLFPSTLLLILLHTFFNFNIPRIRHCRNNNSGSTLNRSPAQRDKGKYSSLSPICSAERANRRKVPCFFFTSNQPTSQPIEGDRGAHKCAQNAIEKKKWSMDLVDT